MGQGSFSVTPSLKTMFFFSPSLTARLAGTLPADKMTVFLQRVPTPIVQLRTWVKMPNNKPSAGLSDRATFKEGSHSFAGLYTEPGLSNCHIKGTHLYHFHDITICNYDHVKEHFIINDDSTS